jgi:hypothetical protein
MQFDEFINSTKEDAPPQSLSEPLQAIWYARKGDWETAHNIAQSIVMVHYSLPHVALKIVMSPLVNVVNVKMEKLITVTLVIHGNVGMVNGMR